MRQKVGEKVNSQSSRAAEIVRRCYGASVFIRNKFFPYFTVAQSLCRSVARMSVARPLCRSVALFLLLYLFIPASLPAVEAVREPSLPAIRIGLTLGLTGRYAEMSEMQRKGLELWKDEINKRGGLLGRKVEIILKDDRSDPAIAMGLYESLIERDRVDLLFGPYSSEITEAIAPIAERHGYPLIASGASADSLWQKGYKYIFGLYTPASRYSQGFLELLVMKGIKDISILSADDPFSRSVADGTKRWAERLELRVRHYEFFKKGEKDLRGVTKKAKASGAQVLILCGHLEDSINMRLSLKDTGWRPIYYATVGPTTEAYRERLGKDSELTFSSSQWEPLQGKGFYESFIKTYGIRPSYHAATAYAAGQILEEAIKRLGKIDGKGLRDVLSIMEATTILGRYKVDRTGIQARHQNLIIQWQKGKKEVVWPESIRTAEPIFR